ncbi:hypothetical protein OS493_010655 [Desmophyllum pertusum]|uniref:Secreted protein n=1 Tax=Desmophyllum pertusum TaxID=174260 RepID=A0A9W9ZQX1_9CNID|nr:hypothetical protein OS493_010655 [Desmophyllum pertusum]
MVTDALLFFALALLSCHLFTRAESDQESPESEHYIIKDCNGIQYRLMIDSGVPPFPATACDVKQKVITCFENSKGSGNLLDQDRFVLLQSAMVDKALMCPDLKYDKLKKSIQNSAIVQELLCKHPVAIPLSPEQCAITIHKNCEKNIFEQVVINHLSWPRTTKWRQCLQRSVKKYSMYSNNITKLRHNATELWREFKTTGVQFKTLWNIYE